MNELKQDHFPFHRNESATNQAHFKILFMTSSSKTLQKHYQISFSCALFIHRKAKGYIANFWYFPDTLSKIKIFQQRSHLSQR